MERSRILVVGLALLAALIFGGVLLVLQPEPTPEPAPALENDVSTSASLSGRVLGPDGEAIEDARVFIVDQQHAARTDADGHWSIDALDPGTYTLDVEAVGFTLPGPVALHGREIVIAEGSDLSVELVLRRPASLSGRVVAGDRPVSDARLSLVYLDAEGLDGYTGPFALDGVATTAQNGTFTIDKVAPGRLRILAEPDDFALGESRMLDIDDGESEINIVLDLLPGGSLTGAVLGPDGEAIAAAEITITSSEIARPRRTSSEADGGFELNQLPAGQVSVEVRANGYRTETLEVEVDKGKESRVSVVLERTSGIYGRVLDTRGDAIHPAFVIYPGHGARSRTETDGAFMWAEAPASIQTVQAISPFHVASRPVTARRGQEMQFVLVDGGYVEGQVVDTAGAPITNYTIVVESFDVERPAPYNNRVFEPLKVSHSTGQFRYGPLRPGKYDFRARAKGLADGTSSRVNVRAGATQPGVRIVLESGATLTGTVRDEAGAAVANARVEVFDPWSPFRTQSVKTTSDGEFTLRGVAPGRRSLRSVKKGYLTGVAAGVEVAAGGQTTRDIVLSKKKPGEAFSFAGIGASLRKQDAGVMIMETFEGQPAEVFGLKKGDVILAVDGEQTREMRLDKVIEMIRGEEGASVDLEIERPDEGELRITVERGRIVVKERK